MLRRPTIVPKYSLHKPSGLAKVKYKGRTIYLGKYDTPESRQKYDRFIAQIASGHEPEPARAPSRGTSTVSTHVADPAPNRVGDITLRYLEFCVMYYRKNGKCTGETPTIRCCLKPLNSLFATLPAREFGPLKLDLVRKEMVRRGWSRGYTNAAVARIKRCFKWAASQELVSAEVAVALSMVPGLRAGRTQARELPPVAPVPDEVIEATLPQLERRCKMAADMVRLQRVLGCRPSELIQMTVAAIDRSDESCWIYRPASHKTEHHGHDRIILIGPKAQAILLKWIARAGRGRLFSYKKRDGYRQAIARAAKRAGQPHWFPLQLRHSAGTEVREQYGLEAAQVILGHSRADVTQVYAERNLKLAKEVARKIG
jgi:integrase